MHKALLALHFDNYSGRAIHRELQRRFPDRFPHLNTVYKEMRAYPRDPSARWSIADPSYDGPAAGDVLRELESVIDRSGVRVTHFTQREAWWVARLCAINPEYRQPEAAGAAYWLAREYVAAEQRGEDTADLDGRVFSPFGPLVPSDEQLSGRVTVTTSVSAAPKEGDAQ